MIQTDNREVQGEFLTQREYIVYKLLIFLPAIDKTEYVWYYIIKERLGVGAFGVVFKGIIKNKLIISGQKTIEKRSIM